MEITRWFYVDDLNRIGTLDDIEEASFYLMLVFERKDFPY
jgi:hypothetical protein